MEVRLRCGYSRSESRAREKGVSKIMALPSRRRGIREAAAQPAGSPKGRTLVVLAGSQPDKALFPLLEGDSELILFTVLQPPPHTGVPAGVPVDDHRLGAAWNALARGRALLEGKGCRVRTAIRTGDPAEEIVRYAREVHADRIAVMPSGEGGPQRSEGVAREIRRRASVPVLVIPRRCRPARQGPLRLLS